MFWKEKKSPEQLEEEKQVTSIVTGLINRNDVERLISPNSGEIFLIDKVNEYYVVIEFDKIIIANHRFSTPIKLGLTFTDGIREIVKDKIEKERQALKKTLFENRLDLLKRINNSINAINN